MARDFVSCDRGQLLLMPPSLSEWLPEDHLVWTVLGAVDQMDLGRFREAYRLGAAGRAPYDPQMLVALLLYAYARGNRSSRGIERACWEDVAFKVIAGMRTPDHSTIAEFRRRHEREIAELFDDVLGLCREAVRTSSTALIGAMSYPNSCAPRRVAARRWRRPSVGWRSARVGRSVSARPLIRRSIWSPRCSLARCCVVAVGVSGRGPRGASWKRIAPLKLSRSRVIARIASFRRSRGLSRTTGLSSPPTRLTTSGARPPNTQGRVLKGNTKPFMAPGLPEGVINLSDPDSRVMRTQGTPPRQAYNAQTAVNEQQIILAAEITVDAPDFGHLEPMLDTTLGHLAKHGVSEQPEVVLGDAGYWHTRQIQAIEERGIEVLVPPDGMMRDGIRPGWEHGFFDVMRRKLATDRGRELYAKRKITVEPVYGQIKYNRRIDRFMRRGRAAAQSEWRLVTATHNLLKLHSHWIANTA